MTPEQWTLARLASARELLTKKKRWADWAWHRYSMGIVPVMRVGTFYLTLVNVLIPQTENRISRLELMDFSSINDQLRRIQATCKVRIKDADDDQD
jgi:hypothetical protein